MEEPVLNIADSVYYSIMGAALMGPNFVYRYKTFIPIIAIAATKVKSITFATEHLI